MKARQSHVLEYTDGKHTIARSLFNTTKGQTNETTIPQGYTSKNTHTDVSPTTQNHHYYYYSHDMIPLKSYIRQIDAFQRSWIYRTLLGTFRRRCMRAEPTSKSNGTRVSFQTTGTTIVGCTFHRGNSRCRHCCCCCCRRRRGSICRSSCCSSSIRSGTTSGTVGCRRTIGRIQQLRRANNNTTTAHHKSLPNITTDNVMHGINMLVIIRVVEDEWL